MLNESIEGFTPAKLEAEKLSKTSTYRDKYVHVEWIEDNFYQLNITDFYLGDTDIAICFRNGEEVLSDREMFIDTQSADEWESMQDRDFHWSDDDSE